MGKDFEKKHIFVHILMTNVYIIFDVGHNKLHRAYKDNQTTPFLLQN